MTRAYCGGTFDLLHPGHVRFFRWVKDNFDHLTISLNRDSFCARYKALPTQTFSERWEMVAACRYVDCVVDNFGNEDSRTAILWGKPAYTHIVNGSDWTRERLMQQMNLSEDFLTERNLSIVLCPLARLFSTTDLKERVKQQ